MHLEKDGQTSEGRLSRMSWKDMEFSKDQKSTNPNLRKYDTREKTYLTEDEALQ